MKNQPKIKCSCCDGTGEIVLDGVYRDTYELLRKQGEIHGAELARIDGCKPTAMNNRLAYLERHGFVVTRKYGRKKYYKTKADN